MYNYRSMAMRNSTYIFLVQFIQHNLKVSHCNYIYNVNTKFHTNLEEYL